MIYFKLELPNLNKYDKKTGFEIKFREKIVFFGYFKLKKYFIIFFKKKTFSRFLFLFWYFKDGFCVFYLNTVSEFLVHFDHVNSFDL